MNLCSTQSNLNIVPHLAVEVEVEGNISVMFNVNCPLINRNFSCWEMKCSDHKESNDRP